MRFSIILNSRKRVPLLWKLLKSIENTTYNSSKIEVLISIDNDDRETEQALYGNPPPFSFKIKYEVIPRSLHLNNRLTNLALQAKGKYILILNDDTEMLSPAWDELAWELLELIPDQIVYGYTHCNSIDKEGNQFYSSFPIVSRKSVDVLGYFMHPAAPSLGGDVMLARVYKELNRIVDTGIHIKHCLHQTVQQVMNPDQTAAEMRSVAYCVDWWNFPLVEDIEKLRILMK